jgi:hypothetical protein
MKVVAWIGGVAVIGLMSCPSTQPQVACKLARDTAKPFVYIKFDHAGPREPLEQGERPRGLWLKLVNNSEFPIVVSARSSRTEPELIVLDDIVTPAIREFHGPEPMDYGSMPHGYASASDISGGTTIEPDKGIVFSIPENHVAPGWFIQVAFQFDMPPLEHGAQPVCYVAFDWDDLPDKFHWKPTP